ncbi:MAG: cytochrome c3 family protein [Candidatus Krumholzibacteriia bacterium]
MKRVYLIVLALVPGILCLGLLTGARKPRAVKSPHKKLKRDCQECHVATSFNDIQFNHNKTTFLLEGQHERISCLKCHAVTDFSKVEKSCSSCHEDPHLGKLGGDCSKCHDPAGFDKLDGEEIHARTDFPLVGRHVLLDCDTCHPGHQAADFGRTPSDCVKCHQQDYLEVTRPSHVASGFPTDCRECHEATGWQPARMPDHDAVFPIFSGLHRGKWDDCVICHTDPGNQKVFNCLGCHAHGQALMDPRHQGIGGYSYSSGACYNCHPTGEAARFLEHDAQFFPIFSRAHNGKWDSCAVCHTDPANRKVYACLKCHAHVQTLMDPSHQGIAGYSYASSACYGCHPTGEAGRFLEHDPQFFPIFSGTHNGRWTGCETCHTNATNRKIFSCLKCHAHNQTAMDPSHQGITGYAYSSTSCYGCHPTGERGQFLEHDAAFFPIFSGGPHAKFGSCTTCHPDAANRKNFTCFNCHAHNQTKMDDVHRGKNGYSYNSNACYNCHPNGKG